MNQTPVTNEDFAPTACAARLERLAAAAPLRLTAEGGGIPDGPYTISPSVVVVVHRREARAAAALLRNMSRVLAGWARYRDALLAAEFDADSPALMELLNQTEAALLGVRVFEDATTKADDTTTWAETAERLRVAGWTTEHKPLNDSPEYLWRSPDGVSREGYRSASPDSIPRQVMQDAFEAGTVDFTELAPVADEPVQAGAKVK